MKYPKINTLWKRDEKGRIIDGEYSCPEFENIKMWDVTEKIDGTNIRVIFRDIKVDFEGNTVKPKIIFKGKTDKAQIPPFLLESLKSMFTVEKFLEAFSDVKEVVLYGEGYGNKIQKNGNKYRDDVSFILFDVVVDGVWLKRDAVKEIAGKLGIEAVPSLGVMTIPKIILLIGSQRQSSVAKQPLTAEGIVARSEPLVLFRKDSTPVMFKLKVKDYLRMKR